MEYTCTCCRSLRGTDHDETVANCAGPGVAGGVPPDACFLSDQRRLAPEEGMMMQGDYAARYAETVSDVALQLAGDEDAAEVLAAMRENMVVKLTQMFPNTDGNLRAMIDDF